jgi:hypothetical protein
LPKETAVLLGGSQEKVKFSKHFAQRNIPEIFTFSHLEFFQHFLSGGQPVMPVSAPFAHNPKAGSCCHVGWDYLCMWGLQYNHR